MLQILEATTSEELDQMRALMTALVAWTRQRYAAHLEQVASYFDAAAFRAELDGLPGAYAPPRGRLLLAQSDGHPAGCAALRPFDASSCEMKRMYVDPVLHRRGVGRALAERLIDEARATGYRRMLLDTGFLQVEALGLYRSLGFVEIAPDYPVPEAARGVLFMELSLAPVAALKGAPPAVPGDQAGACSRP